MLKKNPLTIGLPAIALLLYMVSFSSASCKKEYVEKYNYIYDTTFVQGYNHIVSFSIQDTIKASISSDSIVVYWPVWIEQPEKVAIKVVLPDSAVITPASGDSIMFKDDITFTVVAESGSQRTYKLKIVKQQAMFYFTINGQHDLVAGGRVTVNGDYFIPDINLSKMIFEKLDGSGSFDIPVNRATVTQMRGDIPVTVPAGTYKLRVENGIRSAYNTLEDKTVTVN